MNLTSRYTAMIDSRRKERISDHLSEIFSKLQDNEERLRAYEEEIEEYKRAIEHLRERI